MAQWDVFANPSPRSRDDIPFFVVLQNGLLDNLATRLVMPLSRSEVAGDRAPGRLAPRFEVGGLSVVARAHEVAFLPAATLRRPVASLHSQSHLLIDALDAVVSGI